MRLLIVMAICFALLPLWPTEQEHIETRVRHYPSGAIRESAAALIVPGEDPVYHGQCRRFAENGNLISEGDFNHGRMSGTWRVFDPEGVLLAKGDYLNGYSPNVTFYFSDGSIRSQGPKQGNDRMGTWTQFYPSGRVQLHGDYVDDLMQGTWTWYSDSDPHQSKTAVYEHGELVK